MRPAPILLLLALWILLLPAPGRSGEREDLLSFADALFTEGDHYRAITEYKRFLHLFPADAETPRAALRIAESLLAARRWAEAGEALARVGQSHPGTPEAARAALLQAEIPFRQGEFAAARARYRALLRTAGEEATREELRYRLAWTLIEEDRYAEARQELAPLAAPRPAGLAAEMARMEHLPRKSPRLAGTLSALLPGAGQLYAGRPRDAALALALNAAFIAAAVEAFDNGNEVLGGILLFFEAGWYGGNIYNAASSAHKFNRDRREAEKSGLRERFGVSLDLAPQAALLGVRGRF